MTDNLTDAEWLAYWLRVFCDEAQAHKAMAWFDAACEYAGHKRREFIVLHKSGELMRQVENIERQIAFSVDGGTEYAAEAIAVLKAAVIKGRAQ
jgi:hypothetical protein